MDGGDVSGVPALVDLLGLAAKMDQRPVAGQLAAFRAAQRYIRGVERERREGR
jgi:hypothetical protein